MEPADLWKWHPRIALSFRHVILWLACAEASASRQMAPLSLTVSLLSGRRMSAFLASAPNGLQEPREAVTSMRDDGRQPV